MLERQKQIDLSEFEAGLICRGSSRLDKATETNPVSTLKKKINIQSKAIMVSMKYSSVNAIYHQFIVAKLCKDGDERRWRERNFDKKK